MAAIIGNQMVARQALIFPVQTGIKRMISIASFIKL
jgi:hypothetical protein